jgi:Zn-dependent M28 family amino/carboxypeptidase
MSHIQALAGGIGPRRSGSDAEDAAVDYATDYLRGLGYEVVTTEVTLPSGEFSHNVRATKTGASGAVMLIGAHIDSKRTAPGGNDNASGVAVVLELARDLVGADTAATLQFVLFGAEEMVDSDSDHHHYGSRQFVQAMTAEERAALVGMISVDMVGYGSKFHVRTMNKGPQLLRDMVKAFSNETGLPTTYLRDPGTSGYSDHEPFELAGFPAVWVEWREDPLYHTAGDTYEHCDATAVERAGQMLVQFLAQLDQAGLDALAATRTLR